MGDENRPPKEEKDESGLNEGGDGEGFPAPSSPSTPPPPNKNDQESNTSATTFTYRAACEYLLTLDGPAQTTAEARALEALGPDAPREHILIRAA
ncbi:hypothetical protein ACFQ07_09415, partial [Actinomadura adrarensis]